MPQNALDYWSMVGTIVYVAVGFVLGVLAWATADARPSQLWLIVPLTLLAPIMAIVTGINWLESTLQRTAWWQQRQQQRQQRRVERRWLRVQRRAARRKPQWLQRLQAWGDRPLWKIKDTDEENWID